MSVEGRRGGERASRVSVHVRRVVSVVESQVGVGLVRDCIDCGGGGEGGWGGVFVIVLDGGVFFVVVAAHVVVGVKKMFRSYM